MVNLINEDLFYISTEKKHGNYGDFFSTGIFTKAKLSNPKRDNDLPKRKMIATVGQENEEKMNSNNTRVLAEPKRPGLNSVKIRQSEKYKYDTDIYIAAIPFSGIIKPIEDSYDYRIYKAFVAGNGNMQEYCQKMNENEEIVEYNKIAYMIFIINKTLFDPEHKHHKDMLQMNIESFYKGHSTGDTVKTTYTLKFYPDSHGKYDISVVKDVVNDINVDEFKGFHIFPIFNPSIKKEEESDLPISDDTNNSKAHDKSTVDNEAINDNIKESSELKNEEKENEPVFGDPIVPQGTKLEDMIKKANKDLMDKQKRKDKKSKKKKKN